MRKGKINENKTKKNIEKNFPGTFLDIFHTDQYEDLTKTGWDKLGGQTRKAGICNALEIKVLIEDSYDNAISCSNSEIYVYLLNRPWNQANHLPPNVKRVNDWIEIERSLN